MRLHPFFQKPVRSVTLLAIGSAFAVAVLAALALAGRRPDLDCVVVIRGGGARNELAGRIERKRHERKSVIQTVRVKL